MHQGWFPEVMEHRVEVVGRHDQVVHQRGGLVGPKNLKLSSFGSIFDNNK